jgi:hypothetical protein
MVKPTERDYVFGGPRWGGIRILRGSIRRFDRSAVFAPCQHGSLNAENAGAFENAQDLGEATGLSGNDLAALERRCTPDRQGYAGQALSCARLRAKAPAKPIGLSALPILVFREILLVGRRLGRLECAKCLFIE